MVFKIVSNGYILGVGVGSKGVEITEAEYNELTEIFHAMPVKEGYGYRLKTDLTWEEYKVEPEPVDEIPPEGALEILMGVSE